MESVQSLALVTFYKQKEDFIMMIVLTAEVR